jgi:CheY-like chemotaxis protein
MKNQTHKKILIVDDNPGIVDALQLLLESKGYKVETSFDGEILEDLPYDPPQLILLDLLLSGRDGKELCQILKQNSKTKDIPVIMMSAQPGAEREWEISGAEEFLSKPFEIKKLQEKITKYI